MSNETDQLKKTIKDGNAKIKDIRKEKDFYKALSETYYYNATEELKLTQSLMVIQGCLVEMQMDLMIYKNLHGETDSFNKSVGRVDILLNEIITVSKVQTDNYMLRKLLKDQRNEIETLKNQIMDTVKQNINED